MSKKPGKKVVISPDPDSPPAPGSNPLADAISAMGIVKMEDYGFQMTTNQDSEAIWIRPLTVLAAKEVEGITHDEILEILEVKSLNVLNLVVSRRQALKEKMLEAMSQGQGKPS